MGFLCILLLEQKIFEEANGSALQHPAGPGTKPSTCLLNECTSSLLHLLYSPSAPQSCLPHSVLQEAPGHGIQGSYPGKEVSPCPSMPYFHLHPQKMTGLAKCVGVCSIFWEGPLSMLWVASCYTTETRDRQVVGWGFLEPSEVTSYSYGS